MARWYEPPYRRHLWGTFKTEQAAQKKLAAVRCPELKHTIFYIEKGKHTAIVAGTYNPVTKLHGTKTGKIPVYRVWSKLTD